MKKYSSTDVPNPVSQTVLLQELFRQVLEVPLGEWDIRCHGDFDVAL
jgi:hypothetical protein